MVDQIKRKGVKTIISCGLVRKRWGGGVRVNPLECSETEKYAKIFCEIFERVSVKTLETFPDIFLFLWNQSFLSFLKNIRFNTFWIFLYAQRFFSSKVRKKQFFPQPIVFPKIGRQNHARFSLFFKVFFSSIQGFWADARRQQRLQQTQREHLKKFLGSLRIFLYAIKIAILLRIFQLKIKIYFCVLLKARRATIFVLERTKTTSKPSPRSRQSVKKIANVSVIKGGGGQNSSNILSYFQKKFRYKIRVFPSFNPILVGRFPPPPNRDRVKTVHFRLFRLLRY